MPKTEASSTCMRKKMNRTSLFEVTFIVIIGCLLLGRHGLGQELDQRKEIHLAASFPINGFEGWQGGQACEPAARLALDDVNAKIDLLPGYTLRLHWNDSECDAGRGAAVMYDLLYSNPQKVLLLAGCSTVCTTVAEAARMWNLVTVCYGASSPALSNRKRFPTLFRTHPSATVHNPTRIRVFQQFKWSKIAVLQAAEEVFSTTLDDLEVEAKANGIDIITRQSFLRDPQAAVANLKRQDARIIVGLFYAKAARKVLCESFKQGLYGRKYVWFFIGWYEDDWFQKLPKEENINCTLEEMAKAAEGHFTTEALQWNQDRSPTISGQTVDDFRDRLETKLRENYSGVAQGVMPEGYLEAPLAYDAIWAVALALNRTMEMLHKNGTSLEDYNYENIHIMDILRDQMADVDFMGMSGSVAFSEETGDRIAWTKVEQLQNNKYEVVAFYDQKTNNLTWLPPASNDNVTLTSIGTSQDSVPSKVIWKYGKIPQDRTIIKNKLLKLNLWLYICMVVLALIGIGIAIGLIYFNFRYSHRKIIQHSHPSCNNLMLSGIILCLLAIIPLGLDGRIVSPGFFPVACGMSSWLLTLGFTLGFGSMFSKIWRVHRLSTKTKADSDKKKSRPVVPWKLWVAVGSLLSIDLALLIVWNAVDPLQRQVHNFPTKPSEDLEDDVEIQPQLEHCRANHHTVWLGIMYAYKGLQLVLGLFLAYETRSVKLKQINDSRFVGMAIYNVVILCMITAPVILVIGNQQNASYCFISLANLFCCYLSMALIFIPKITFIRQHAHDPREKEDDEKENAEQERKYRELLKINEDLQKKVAEKEQRLSLLKKFLADKKEKEKNAAIVNREETCEEPLNNNVAEAKVQPQEHDSLMSSLVASSTLETADIVASASGAPLSSQSAITDLERTASMRGITVLRGHVTPKRQFGDEHVESYL